MITVKNIDEPMEELGISIGPHIFEKSFGEKYISFLRMIEENPQDPTAKLIMCDFLEESNQIELRNAWLEIIRTKKIPRWYEAMSYVDDIDDIIYICGWHLDANFYLNDPNEFNENIQLRYRDYLTGAYEPYNVTHPQYGNDFIYAYHDYAQAIVQFEKKMKDWAESLLDEEIEDALQKNPNAILPNFRM